MGTFSKSVPYEVGDTVTYCGRDRYGHLMPGEKCRVTDIQKGVFAGDFYAIVISTESGKTAAAHYWRFTK